MCRVVDLELWSPPGTSLLDGKAVAEACRSATAAPPEIILGLNFVPEEADTKSLVLSFAEDPQLALTFQNFCHEQGLSSEWTNVEAAARFMVFIEGQPLAWLHFRTDPSGKGLALSVCRWATDSGYVIRSGQGERSLSESAIHALWD